MFQTSGSTTSKLWIIQEGPSTSDEQSGIPFSGPNCRDIPDGYKITLRPSRCKDDRPYIQDLHAAIREHKPYCILVFGNLLLKELTGNSGIDKYRGSILQYAYLPLKVVASRHPETLFKPFYSDSQAPGYYYKYLIRNDIQKAERESASPVVIPKERRITIAKTGKQLWEFISRERPKKNKYPLCLDIETLHTIPICLGFGYRPEHVCVVPLLNISFSPGWQEIPEDELAYMWTLLDREISSESAEIVGQNLRFDWQKIRNILGFQPRNFGGDPMYYASVLSPETPKSLGFLTSVWCNTPFWKDEGKDYWKEAGFRRRPVDDLFLYNGKDVAGTLELVQVMDSALGEFREFYETQVKPLFPIYIDLECEGLDYDFDAKAKLLLRYKLLLFETTKEWVKVCNGVYISPRSPKLKDFFFNDLKFPVRDKLDEDTIISLYANHAKTDRQRMACDLVIRLRGILKTIDAYIYSLPDWDDKYRSQFNPVGTETGRSSSSILDPPTRIEFKHGKTKKLHVGLAFQTIPSHSEFGADLRRMFIAPKGYVFLDCDLSQAEARIVALLANDQETLTLFDTTDIHKLTATWLFPGYTLEQITKEIRFVGKTARHAGNYGMGKRRLMIELQTNAKKLGISLPGLSEKMAGEILDRFHSATPKIRGVFHKEVVLALERDQRYLFNAFGRPRLFLDYWGDKLFQSAYAQIPQSTVKDKIIDVLKKCRETTELHRCCIEAHDGLTFKVKENELESGARLLKSFMESPISFSKCSIPRGDLIIPCEMKVGSSLGELKNYVAT